MIYFSDAEMCPMFPPTTAGSAEMENTQDMQKRMKQERNKRYREKQKIINPETEKDRSQKRRRNQAHADKRDHQSRSSQRREEGTHADKRDHQSRSSQRREEGTHADNRDHQSRSSQRREDGTHADNRDQQLRSFQRRQDGSHVDHRNEGQRSADGRESGTLQGNRDIRRADQDDQQHDDETSSTSPSASTNQPPTRGSRTRPGQENFLSEQSQDIADVLLNNQFSRLMKEAVEIKICNTCMEIDLLSGNTVKRNNICSRCSRRGMEKKFSAENGMIPDEVPLVLKNLTFLEEMLISKQISHMHIARLRSGGQFGYKNHVISFPQDLTNLTIELPRRINDTGILVVRKQGINNTHRDYRVRRQTVLDALTWLQQNNPCYHDIRINHGNLAVLPENGIPMDLPTETLADNEENTSVNEDQPSEENNEEMTEFTSIDDVRGTTTEIDHIRTAVNDGATVAEQPVQWPRQNNSPANEYNVSGLFTQLFPTLFPKATADHSRTPDHLALSQVKRAEWIKHLMCFHDGRFARHPRFRYQVYDMIQRQRANETGRVFVRRNEEQRDIPLEDLRTALQEGQNAIEWGLLHFGSSIRGTTQWKLSKRLELADMIAFLGMPTFFITFSAADLHWPDLQYLLKKHEEGPIPPDAEIDEAGRNGRVIRNPHLVDAFFVKRIELFFEG